jgi:hypothetical protein
MPGDNPRASESDFEKAIDAYADTVIAKEKEGYSNTLESFEVHAKATREKVREAMHSFQKGFGHGYTILLEEIEAMIKEGDTKAAPIEKYKAKLDKADILADGEKFAAYLSEEGNAIYQLLGFKTETLGVFYAAACRLVQKSVMKRQKMAFTFW